MGERNAPPHRYRSSDGGVGLRELSCHCMTSSRAFFMDVYNYKPNLNLLFKTYQSRRVPLEINLNLIDIVELHSASGHAISETTLNVAAYIGRLDFRLPNNSSHFFFSFSSSSSLGSINQSTSHSNWTQLSSPRARRPARRPERDQPVSALTPP
jgi:hypothetical protein